MHQVKSTPRIADSPAKASHIPKKRRNSQTVLLLIIEHN